MFLRRTPLPAPDPPPPDPPPPEPHRQGTPAADLLPLDSARLPSAGPPKISLFFPFPASIFALFFFSLLGRRGFTRQPENSKRAPALQTPPTFHEKTPTEREREKSENGGRRGKKKREILGPAFGPPTLRANTPPGPIIPAPTLRAEVLGAPTFFWFGLEPLRSSFYHITHLFFFWAFLIVSISCHFLWKFHCFCFFFKKKKTLIFFTFFHFSKLGVWGGRGVTTSPNPNPPLLETVVGGSMDRLVALSWFYRWWCMAVLSWWLIPKTADILAY